MQKMTKEEIMVLYALQDLIDNQGQNVGRFFYTPYLDEGNIRIVRGTKSKSDRLNMLLPDNPETSELDWWIMYAVTVLRLADKASIYRYLCAEKKRHPELMYSVKEPRVINQHISRLARWGFLMHYSYVAHTDVAICDAEQVFKAEEEIRDKARRDSFLSSAALSLDDDYMDEEDEVEYVTYNEHAYTDYLGGNKERYFGRRIGSETFSQRGYITKYYGKEARLVELYSIEEDSYHWVKNRFGSNAVPSFLSHVSIQLSFDQIGSAATGQAISYLSSLPTYKCMRSCKINSKFNGTFVIPGELEFEKESKTGKITYQCGVFTDYYFPGKGRVLEQHTQRNLMDTFYQIKNYIGINSYKEGSETKKDCFAVVVVNDMLDISKFLFKLLKRPGFVSQAEIERIYFTGEGILESNYGAEYMIGFQLDSGEESGYSLIPVKLPVV